MSVKRIIRSLAVLATFACLFIIVESVFAQNATTFYNRGTESLNRGYLDSAIADFDRTIQADPNYDAAYNNRGIAFLRKGELDNAVFDFEAALQRNPNDATAQQNIELVRQRQRQAHITNGNNHFNDSDFDRAITEYTNAIRIESNSVIAHFNRGLAYARKGDLNRAIADYETTLRLDPNYTRARETLESARQRQRQAQEQARQQAQAQANRSSQDQVPSARRALAKAMEYVNHNHDNGSYKGQISNGNRNGLGIYYWHSGEYYFGGWSGGDRSGFGIRILRDGYELTGYSGAAIYAGNFSNNNESGTGGTYYDKFGNLLYTGNFSNGKPTGTYPTTGDYSAWRFQTIEYNDGARYVGTTKDGQRHGYGAYIWSNGNIWFGDWANGARSGRGIFIPHNASRWEVSRCTGDNCTKISASDDYVAPPPRPASASSLCRSCNGAGGLLGSPGMVCSSCRGTGMWNNRTRCSYCSGTGYMGHRCLDCGRIQLPASASSVTPAGSGDGFGTPAANCNRYQVDYDDLKRKRNREASSYTGVINSGPAARAHTASNSLVREYERQMNQTLRDAQQVGCSIRP